MLTAPDIDPVVFRLGPLSVHWYGLMYLFGFGGAWLMGRYRAGLPESGWNRDEVADLVFYFALGAVLGGRLGYVLFYNFPFFLEHPLQIFYVWKGGMSFHGGVLGGLFAFWLYARKTQRNMLQVADFSIVLVPIGLFFGRIGNFINQELWGKVTDVAWGVVFTRTGGSLPRHPSQLYEAFLEGIVLLIILVIYVRKPRPAGAALGMGIMCYGVFRSLVEFVRVPDAHIGYLAFDWLTMGQVLSFPMIVFGAGLIAYAYRRNRLSS